MTGYLRNLLQWIVILGIALHPMGSLADLAQKDSKVICELNQTPSSEFDDSCIDIDQWIQSLMENKIQLSPSELAALSPRLCHWLSDRCWDSSIRYCDAWNFLIRRGICTPDD